MRRRGEGLKGEEGKRKKIEEAGALTFPLFALSPFNLLPLPLINRPYRFIKIITLILPRAFFSMPRLITEANG